MTDPNAALVESWQLALHDRSARTRGLYLQCMTLFTRWLGDNDRTTDLLVVDRQDVEAWFTAQAVAGLAAATRRSRWRIALRSFYNWATEEDEVAVNPMTKVKVARPDVPPPPVLDDDDIRALLRACQGHRLYEAPATPPCCAPSWQPVPVSVRLGRLQVADVDLVARIVVITHGKGGRRRMVRVDAATAAAIDRYRRARGRHRHADRADLWLGTKGPLSLKGVVAALDSRARIRGREGVPRSPAAPLVGAPLANQRRQRGFLAGAGRLAGPVGDGPLRRRPQG